MRQQLGAPAGHWAKRIGISLLLVQSTLHAQTTPTSPQPNESQVEAGFKLILERQQGNCLTCHTLSATSNPHRPQKELGQQGNFGPALDGVGARYNSAALLQWVTDARKLKSDALMPPYGSLEGVNQPNTAHTLLTPQQLQAVAAALSTLR